MHTGTATRLPGFPVPSSTPPMRTVGKAVSILLFGWFLVVMGSMATALVLKLRRGSEPVHGDDRVDVMAAFDAIDLRSRSSRFEGGTIVAMFGEASIDLRRAVPWEHGPHLEATAAFGKIEITVPDDWIVTVIGPTVAGRRQISVTDPADAPPGAPRLSISARTFAGSLEVVSRAVLKATG